MKLTITRTFAASLFMTIALAACTNPVGKQESGVDTPSFWSFSSTKEANLNMPMVADNEAVVEHEWWKHFKDPVLDSLIAEALKNNKSLAIAKARVTEARANRIGAKSVLYPQIDGTASAERINQGLLTLDKTYSIAEADVEANWEIDLFGENQAKAAESKAILQSTDASRQAITVGLLAEVARTYFDMRNYSLQIQITKANLANQRKTLQLINEQLKGALVSDFDVQRAGAQVSTTESLLPTQQIQFDMAQNRLNVLLGKPPGTKIDALMNILPLAPLDQKTVLAAPATVLATRPDVKVAERQFAASISASDAATRELFPKINLLGLFGVQGSVGDHSNPWTLAGTVSLPILNFGKIQSQIDAADARQQQAYLNYQQTVLQAIEDMENALSNYINETGRNVSLNTAVVQNRKAADLAKQQYTNGYIGLIDVLVVDRNVLDAESAAAASDVKLRKDLVNIYTAAGGGWDVEKEQRNAAKND